LKTLPWNLVDIGIVIVDSLPYTMDKIAKYLISKGFIYYKQLQPDGIFLNSSKTWPVKLPKTKLYN